MNILFCYDYSFSRLNGGIANVSLVLMDGLRRRGHKCYGISAIPKNDEKRENLFYLPNKTICLNNSENICWFCNFLKEKSIDVIINQNGTHPRSVWPLVWSQKSEVRKITVYHSGFYSLFSCHNDYILNHPFVKMFRLRHLISFLWIRYFRLKYGGWFRKHLIWSDYIVTLSAKYHAELEWFTGVTADNRFKSVYNAVAKRYDEIDGLKLNKEKEVLFVGRISWEKRVDYLLAVWKKVSLSHPDWCLIIVGDGPLRKQFERQCLEEGIERVSFEGYMDPLQFYKRAKVNCITSSTEGFAIVLVEAMCCGCVPIAFNSYACASDIIDDGQCGFLIKPFDIDEYARRLSELMDNEDLRRRLAVASKNKTKLFSLEKIVKEWENILTGI